MDGKTAIELEQGVSMDGETAIELEQGESLDGKTAIESHNCVLCGHCMYPTFHFASGLCWWKWL